MATGGNKVSWPTSRQVQVQPFFWSKTLWACCCRLEHPAVIHAELVFMEQTSDQRYVKNWENWKNRRESFVFFLPSHPSMLGSCSIPSVQGQHARRCSLGLTVVPTPSLSLAPVLFYCSSGATVLAVGSGRIPFAVHRKWAAHLEQRIFADRRKSSSSPFMDSNLCLFDLNSGNRKNTSVFRWLCAALTNRWQSCLMVFDLTEWLISSAF